MRHQASSKKLNMATDELSGSFPEIKRLAEMNYREFEEQGIDSTDLMRLIGDTLSYSDVKMLKNI